MERWNLGAWPFDAVLEGLELAQCGSGLSVLGAALPKNIPAYSALYLETYFEPVDASTLDCEVELTADSPFSNAGDSTSVSIPAQDQGVDVTHWIDQYTQAPPPAVDILFVVDDSCSPNEEQLGGPSHCTMNDEQMQLRDQMATFIESAATWAQTYRMAVTTTDTVKVNGVFQGAPKVYDSEGTTPLSGFADNVIVGITGDHHTAGLEAAWLALNGLHLQDTDIECLEDVPGQCPFYGDDHLMSCIDGSCRGPNYGFLREDAELMIIIVSDKDDLSPEAVSWYVQQLLSLKPGAASVTLHALVTPETGGTGGTGGTVAIRYIQAATALGGKTASICTDDFGAELGALGAATFGLRRRFYASLPVDPETLVVRVQGVECGENTGWSWNASISAVVLEEDGLCWPAEGEVVELEYDVACEQPASP